MSLAFQVGPWLVDPGLNSISRNGTSVRLEPKVMEVLMCLAENAGSTVSKEKVIEKLWPDTFVSDDALKHCISELRRVFGDDAREPRVIQTIAKRGYRLIAPVSSPAIAGQVPRAVSRDSIVVLPFVNLSTEAENEFFADGITEEIINALAQIQELQVVARSSAFSFKGKHIDPRVLGEQLNVRTVLEGSVRRAGESLRITVQLINASDGFHLWSERYDRKMKGVFAVQDEIARSIAARLKVTFDRSAQEPLVKAGTENLEAYQLYLKGRALLYRRGGSIAQAVKCFEQAVAFDSQYALGWASLSESYTTLGYYSLAPPEPIMSKAIEAAQQAVALGPGIAEAHHALGMAYLMGAWNKTAAEREFLRARELNPRNTHAREWYAVNYLQLAAGRLREGAAEAEMAMQSDRLSSYAHAVCSLCYSILDQHADAVQAARTATQLDPDSYLARLCLQGSLHLSGAFEESVAAGESALAMSNRHSWSMGVLAMALADWGKLADADAVYAEMLARARRQYQPPALLAVAASAAEKEDQAIAHARDALGSRDPSSRVFLCRHFPYSARLYAYPRFRELLSEVGFE